MIIFDGDISHYLVTIVDSQFVWDLNDGVTHFRLRTVMWYSLCNVIVLSPRGDSKKTFFFLFV